MHGAKDGDFTTYLEEQHELEITEIVFPWTE